MKNILYNSLLGLFVVVFVASGSAIGYKLFAKQKVNGQLEELKTVFQTEKEQPEALDTEKDGAAGPPEGMTLSEQLAARESRLLGYEALRAKNGDMKGWITIPGTKVDYPAMQSVDRPDYYLKRDFDGKKSSHGTPYIAESCDLEGDADNIVIYGHHMKDGTMFAELMKYEDKSFYEAHPLIWFDTPDRVGLYEIVAVTKASASDREDDRMFSLAADSGRRQEFLDEVAGRSFYDTGCSLWDDGKPLLVLITCEYTQNEGRLLVVARQAA